MKKREPIDIEASLDALGRAIGVDPLEPLPRRGPDDLSDAFHYVFREGRQAGRSEDLARYAIAAIDRAALEEAVYAPNPILERTRLLERMRQESRRRQLRERVCEEERRFCAQQEDFATNSTQRNLEILRSAFNRQVDDVGGGERPRNQTYTANSAQVSLEDIRANFDRLINGVLGDE